MGLRTLPAVAIKRLSKLDTQGQAVQVQKVLSTLHRGELAPRLPRRRKVAVFNHLCAYTALVKPPTHHHQHRHLLLLNTCFKGGTGVSKRHLLLTRHPDRLVEIQLTLAVTGLSPRLAGQTFWSLEFATLSDYFYSSFFFLPFSKL